ncbi:transmembrane 6 superfamily member 1-like [Lytechinus variegatus]|uniref:transmembrane 6 superfamily member 1-like n=1 Tax=Lytechinus variegatus TaxID=7654 RepID=UPI001BB22BE1|nr:transmembrane 6 superfamily member 1-like [Lytechinus variegatus]
MAMATGVFFLSLTAIPVTYLANALLEGRGEGEVLTVGYGVLATIALMSYVIVRLSKGSQKVSDPFFYVFAVFAFTSVVDIVLAMELDGIIDNFMASYLKEGEPYLNTAHGTLINYWDGSGHYCMYLMMVTAIVWGQSYKEVGLYWAGSILNSMVVFMPGNVSGKYGSNVKSSYFLNIPYVLFPILVALKCLRQRPETNVERADVVAAQKKSIWKRPLDVFFVLFLFFAILISFLRMAAALKSPASIAVYYLKNFEPYFQDPVLYPMIQALVYWFYFVPYFVAAIYGFLNPGCTWMSDWALLSAGASAQAQFSHIGSSLHSRTPYIYRVPSDGLTAFWIINVALMLVPQLIAWRCLTWPAFFEAKPCSSEVRDGKSSLEQRKDK